MPSASSPHAPLIVFPNQFVDSDNSREQNQLHNFAGSFSSVSIVHSLIMLLSEYMEKACNQGLLNKWLTGKRLLFNPDTVCMFTISGN